MAGRICKQVLTNTVERGGLNAPDVFAIDKAIKYKALLQNSKTSHPLRNIYETLLKGYGFSFSNYFSTNCANDFISIGIKAHKEAFKILNNDIKSLSNMTDGIHKNYYSIIQNYELCKNVFTNVRQNNMIMRLNVYNIDTFQKLQDEYNVRRYPNLYLDVYQIYNSFPAEWRRLGMNTTRRHDRISEVNIDMNKWVNINCVTLKMLTRSLSRELTSNNVISLLEKKHPGLNMDQIKLNPFEMLRKNIKDVKVRNLQYKMLHNIYPTMSHLYKWKIKQTELCSACHVKETLRHVTVDCPIARESFKHLRDVAIEKYNLNPHQVEEFNTEEITFGLGSTKNRHFLNYDRASALDTVIIDIKQRLILQREQKHQLSREEIALIFENRKNIDKYNKVKYRKNKNISIKWGN